jgi:hypothetical protein
LSQLSLVKHGDQRSEPGLRDGLDVIEVNSAVAGHSIAAGKAHFRGDVTDSSGDGSDGDLGQVRDDRRLPDARFGCMDRPKWLSSGQLKAKLPASASPVILILH